MHPGDEKSGVQQQQPIQGSKTAGVLPVLCIMLVCLILYAGALSGGFIYDDNLQVLKNPLIRDLRHIPEIFRRSAWTFEGAPETSNYYRPLQNLFYLFTYYISGLQAWGFHVVNVLFHTANALLVFFITARIVGDSRSSSSYAFVTPPLIAALLFATHPVNTEAVIWVAGLPDVSFAFFYLLSFYFYLPCQDQGARNYLLSLAAFFLATLCKEPGLTLPFVLIAYDYVFREASFWSFNTVKRHMPYLIIAGIYLFIRISVLGDFAPLEPVVSTSSYEAAISIFPLFSRYLALLLLPVNLNFWPVFDALASLLSLRGIAALAVSISFLGAIWVAARKKSLTFLSLLFILVPLLPALYVQGIIGKPLAERYLYLSTFGFALLPAHLLQRAGKEYQRAAPLLPVIFLLVIGIYSAGTISRSRVWRDDVTLFSDTVKKSPESLVPRLELGNALLAKGYPGEAITQYQAALRMDPNLYVIHYHLGIALEKKNRLYDAVEQYLIATALNPAVPDIHADAGRAYAKSGFLDPAIEQFLIAVQLQPSKAYQRNLLGVAYMQKGLIDNAIEQFTEAASLDPSTASFTRNLSDAIAGKKSAGSLNSLIASFGERYEERPVTTADIIKFAR